MVIADDLDRISSLPKDVIGEIIKRLSPKEAVATSNLSKTWRYNWMCILELVFNQLYALQRRSNSQLLDFVDDHGTTFTESENQSYLDSRWLIILSRKRLTILFRQLQLSAATDAMLSYQHSTKLVLQGCALQLPSPGEFKGFKNLTILHLIAIVTCNETLEFLVNNSPFLKHLVLGLEVSTISQLRITAPNLEFCTIVGSYGDITFIHAPKLRSVHVKTWLPTTTSLVSCRLDTLLGGLVDLNRLVIFNPFLEVDNFRESLSASYYHLTHVHLVIDFQDPKQILAALWLLTRAPSLNTLNVTVLQVDEGVCKEDLCVEEFYETLDKEEDILRSLDVFEIDGFRGSENELRFIQFLLLKANVLQTLGIKGKDNDIGEDTRRAMGKLACCRRTSPGMKVKLIGWVKRPPNVESVRPSVHPQPRLSPQLFRLRSLFSKAGSNQARFFY